MEALRSNRGNRSPSDVLIIVGFVKSYLPQVAGVLSDDDLQELCNEIDWVTANDKSIVFLQNEPADSYYLIGKGSVNLYYENDDCVSHALQLSFRPASCHQLGSFVGQLLRGHGFGEYALLANSLSKSETSHHSKRRHKYNPRPIKPQSTQRKSKGQEQNVPAGRSCTAICGSDDTLLFVVYEATYNRIFKKFHHTQRQLAHTIHFMKKLPIFRHASLAKVTQIALKTNKTKLPFKSALGECGYNIEHVSIVMNGVVRVGSRAEASQGSSVLLDDAFILETPSVSSVETGLTAFAGYSVYSGYSTHSNNNYTGTTHMSSLHDHSTSTVRTMPLPQPSIATLRAGQIVGDIEVHKGINTYKFHYDVQSLSAEVLQIPYAVYLECARDAAFNDPHCANLTVLCESERAQRSADRLYKLRFVRGCEVQTVVCSDELSENVHNEAVGVGVVGCVDVNVSEGEVVAHVCAVDTSKGTDTANTTLHSTHDTSHTQHNTHTNTPHTTHTKHTKPHIVPTLNLCKTAPLRHTAPTLPLPLALASPPTSGRPSKTSYRTQRPSGTSSTGGGSVNGSGTSGTSGSGTINAVVNSDTSVCANNTPRTIRTTTSTTNHTNETTSNTTITNRSDGVMHAVFTPAPPMGSSPREARAGHRLHTADTTTSHGSHTPHTSHDAHYPNNNTTTNNTHYTNTTINTANTNTTTTSGPNGSHTYASTHTEAAQYVQRELQAIRQRVRVKQKSIGFEDIRLDPAELSD